MMAGRVILEPNARFDVHIAANASIKHNILHAHPENWGANERTVHTVPCRTIDVTNQAHGHNSNTSNCTRGTTTNVSHTMGTIFTTSPAPPVYSSTRMWCSASSISSLATTAHPP